MKKTVLIALLVLVLGVGTASAQLGNGVVYDPTNYQNAVLRYQQLQKHLIQLQKSYDKITSHLNLALQMAKFVQNMPARYRAVFSQWRTWYCDCLFAGVVGSGQFVNVQIIAII